MKLEFVEHGSRDCPLIRFYEFSPAEAQTLRNLVRELAEGDSREIHLDQHPWIEKLRGCKLVLRLGGRDRGVRQFQSNHFECVLTSQGWHQVEGLLDRTCESTFRGFQWLISMGDISLLISSDGRW
jgi:hypothetical protein